MPQALGFGGARTRAGIYSEHAAAEKRNEVKRIPHPQPVQFVSVIKL